VKLVGYLLGLLLALGIFGAAGWFAYQIYVKPEKLDREAAIQEAEAPPPTPPPDYSLPALQKAVELKKAGQLAEARQALLDFLAQYPQSTGLADAKNALGEINTQFVFTSMPAPDKLDYTVVSGDSLVKIASKTKASAELILRSNNLATIDLQIGQQLRIPQLDTAIVIDRAAKTLTLLNNGEFFKEYPLLAVQGSPTQTEIKDKVALHGSERVAFGDRNWIGSDRWLMLGSANLVIRGLPEPEDGSEPAIPPGIVVSQEDIEEIFPLVGRGTPVSIQ
jgi:Uncharacterized protein conserved in bacteria